MDPSQIKKEFRALIIKEDTTTGLNVTKKYEHLILVFRNKWGDYPKAVYFFPLVNLIFSQWQVQDIQDTQGGSEAILTFRIFPLDFQMS